MVILCGSSKKTSLWNFYLVQELLFEKYKKSMISLRRMNVGIKAKILAIILIFKKVLLAFLITICLVVGPWIKQKLRDLNSLGMEKIPVTKTKTQTNKKTLHVLVINFN